MSDIWPSQIAALDKRHRIGTILHLGAGEGGQLAACRATSATQIVLVEPQKAAQAALRQKAGGDARVLLLPVAVAESTGQAALHMLNLGPLSGLRAPTGLRQLFPGLRPAGKAPTDTLSITDILARMSLPDDRDNVLLLDAPGEEASVLDALIAANQLQRFAHVLIHCGQQPLYAGSEGAAALIARLEPQGYRVEADGGDDPDMAELRLRLDVQALESTALMAAAEARIAELTAALEAEREKTSAGLAETGRLTALLEGRSAELDTTRSDLKMRDSDLATARDHRAAESSQLSIAQAERDAALHERDAAQAQRTAAEIAQADAIRQLLSATAALEQRDADMAALQAEITTLTERIETLQTERKVIVQDRDSARAQLTERDTSLASERAARTAAEAATAERDAQLAERDAQLADGQAEIARLAGQIETLQTERKVIVQGRDTARVQLAERDKSLAGERAARTTAEATAAERAARLAERDAQLAERDQALAEGQAEIARLAGQIETLQTERKVIVQGRDTARVQLAERDKSLAGERAARTTAEATAAERAARLAEYDKALAIERENTTLEAKARNAAEAVVAERDKALAKAQADLSIALRQQTMRSIDLRDLQGRYATLLAERDTQNALLAALTQRLTAAAQVLQRMKDDPGMPLLPKAAKRAKAQQAAPPPKKSKKKPAAPVKTEAFVKTGTVVT